MVKQKPRPIQMAKKDRYKTMAKVKKTRQNASIGLFCRREMLNFWIFRNGAYISDLGQAAVEKSLDFLARI